MNHILLIHSSIYGTDGASSQLTEQLADRLTSQGGATQITRRNLGERRVPHLNADTHQAFAIDPQQHTAAQRQAVKLSDELIAELQAADTLIIGAPFYNFGVPSELKAWIDHVVRAGVTFTYTDEGPKGLLDNKKVYVVATRGGRYAGTDADTQTPYLKQVLAFIGLTDVEFVYAEGLAMPEKREAALAEATQTIQHLAA